MTRLTISDFDKKGFDKRQMRRGHRRAARTLLDVGGLFNAYCAPGSSFWLVARWHLKRARSLGR